MAKNVTQINKTAPGPQPYTLTDVEAEIFRRHRERLAELKEVYDTVTVQASSAVTTIAAIRGLDPSTLWLLSDDGTQLVPRTHAPRPAETV